MAEADTTTTDPTPNPTTDPVAAPAAAPVAAPAAAIDDPTILGGGDPVADPAAADPVAAAPVVPEKYELAMPEGVTLDADAFAIAEPVFREAGLSNDQAQKLAEAFPGIAEGIAKRTVEATQQALVADVVKQRKDWADQTMKLPELGGPNFEASKANAGRFIDSFGGAELRSILDDSGLGNHPALFAAFAKAGALLGEDGFTRGGATHEQAPVWDRAYKTPPASSYSKA